VEYGIRQQTDVTGVARTLHFQFAPARGRSVTLGLSVGSF
jgi:hypothetical protein